MRYFILAMLLLPLMFGCSKESDTIVGDWFMCYFEVSSSDCENPENNYSESQEFTKETTYGFMSLTTDNKFTIQASDESVVKGTWSLKGRKLTLQYDEIQSDETQPELPSPQTVDIVFDGDDKFFLTYTESYGSSIYKNKQGWQRM